MLKNGIVDLLPFQAKRTIETLASRSFAKDLSPAQSRYWINERKIPAAFWDLRKSSLKAVTRSLKKIS
jgi:hypothetical protein